MIRSIYRKFMEKSIKVFYIIIPKRAMIMISNYYVSTAIIGYIKNLSISHLFMRLISKCDIEFSFLFHKLQHFFTKYICFF